MRRVLTNDEFGRLLNEFEQTAFRLQLQPAYNVVYEAEAFARWLAGDLTPPTDVPELADWFDHIRHVTLLRRTMLRVRVQENPLTDYQRWESWAARWNRQAGEQLRRMTRQEAVDCGLLPQAGSRDWWLLDDRRLILMSFDETGRRVLAELVENDPLQLSQARMWRDLAIHHSVRDDEDVDGT